MKDLEKRYKICCVVKQRDGKLWKEVISDAGYGGVIRDENLPSIRKEYKRYQEPILVLTWEEAAAEFLNLKSSDLINGNRYFYIEDCTLDYWGRFLADQLYWCVMRGDYDKFNSLTANLLEILITKRLER